MSPTRLHAGCGVLTLVVSTAFFSGCNESLPHEPPAPGVTHTDQAGAIDATQVSFESQWGTDLCMSASGSRAGAKVVLAVCENVPAQAFEWKGTGALRWQDMCVTAEGSGNGSAIVLQACNGGALQEWGMTERDELRNAGGLCIDFSRSGGGAGTALQLWRCADVPNQKWNVMAGAYDTGSLGVEPASGTVSVGNTLQLNPVFRDAAGTVVPGGAVTWSTSDPAVATVNSDGFVGGVTPGSATITASGGGHTSTAAITVTAGAEPVPPSSSSQGVWVGAEEIAGRPTSGDDWNQLVQDAGRNFGTANIADQNSKHGQYVLAAALVCARTGQHCVRARQGVLDAIGTERGARWLAVGRTLGAYIIAADVLNLRADGVPNSEGSRVNAWIAGWLTTALADNVSGQLRTFAPYHSGSNAAAQEGFAHAAVAAYLGNRLELDRNWTMFRAFVCDARAPNLPIDLGQGVASGWAHDDARPCAINPAGTSKRVPAGLPGAGGTYRIDGALINDMRRGGPFQWEPGFTQYAWTGLAGVVPAAVVLHRAGYPAFDAANRAVLRTHEYLWYLRQQTGNTGWFDGRRGSEVVRLVNYYYGTSYQHSSPVAVGHTIGYTGWTHPR
jgi:hypothetical protein